MSPGNSRIRLTRYAFLLAPVAAIAPFRAAGWSMETPLDQSTASFLGDAETLGFSVSSAGDVNGDGLGDFLMGGKSSDAGGVNTGQVYLVLGAPGGWALDTPASSASASFWGEQPEDFTYRTSGAGDVNGDGFDDFVISTPNNDEAATNAGQVYLVLGKESGWSMDTPLSEADASYWGEAAEDWAGYAASGAGDVNGDGYHDLIVGALTNGEAAPGAGQAYLVFGREAGWEMDVSLSHADASFLGESAADNAGTTVAGAGDVNGDGYDDVLVGAPYSNDAGLHAGEVYLVLGRAQGWAMDVSLSEADVSFLGEDTSDWAGYDTIASAGDVNGDGLDDIFVGVSNSDVDDQRGQAYLWFGRTTGWGPNTPLSLADASFLGETTMDSAGYDLSGLGDVDGDGYDDLVIASPSNGEVGIHAGQSYLVLGKANGWAMGVSLEEANASFLGELIDDAAGLSVSGAGDVDGDGYNDILIGAPFSDESGVSAGQVYLITGSPCVDADGDGYRDCDQDCEEDDPTIHPGAADVCGDEIDNDCDGEVDEEPAPDIEEVCDGVDNDCDGIVDQVDADGDGYIAEECGGEDCDDSSAAASPEGDEATACDDGLDNDCDGDVDGQDYECVSTDDDTGDDDTTDPGDDDCQCRSQDGSPASPLAVLILVTLVLCRRRFR